MVDKSMGLEKGSISSKAVAAGLSVAIGLGVSARLKEAKADDTLKQLIPITTAKKVYEANHWSQVIVADYFDVLHPEDKDKYLYLGLPSVILSHLQGDASLKENNDRADFYRVVMVPKWAINGIVSQDKFTDTGGLKFIPEGIKTAKQWANLEISQEKENFYTLQLTGANEELNKRKNLNVNLIAFREEVNCNNNKDAHRTRILKRVAYKYPLGALGKRIELEKGKIALQKFNLNIPPSDQNLCKLVAFVQDMNTKEILAAGWCEMIDGQTALFNWDNLPECTVDLKDIGKYTGVDDLGRKLPNYPQYQDKTGLKEKVFYVQKAKDLKYLSLQLDYTDTEAQIYQVLAAGLNPELKDKAIFQYRPKDNKVDITFTQPINGDQELFSFFIKINKPRVDGVEDTPWRGEATVINSVNFKVKEFYAYDAKYNLIKYQLREQKNYFPVRMCTIVNPLDFNSDTWVNQKDLEEIGKRFGSREGDKDFEAKYDVNQSGTSQNRVDILDVLDTIREVNDQAKLEERIKKLNKP